MEQLSLDWLNHLNGWLAPDAYSTAWVALVPDLDDPERPAWPQTLAYLRASQLDDGGWGTPDIYYAHERTISTLAAIRALQAWQPTFDDLMRVERGLKALRRHASNLSHEPHEPVGFELLLPSLRAALSPIYDSELPLREWERIEALGREKLALIERLDPDPLSPRAWWFSLEMLPPDQLAQLDDSLLEENGSIVTSTAATAAYLNARRRAGADSPRAAHYLDQVVALGEGSVPFSWPAEVFDRVWALDNLRRAGFEAAELPIRTIVESLRRSWELNQPGLSSSDFFPVNDGDDTLVGYTVLAWAGAAPPEEPLINFWNGTHFRSYMDERSASVSANIHGLTALRMHPGFPRRDLAEALTAWLVAHMKEDGSFDDKWHLSPLYTAAHAVPAFAGWQDALAGRCLTYLLDEQRGDGGWGCFGCTTFEETAHVVLALDHAYREGLLREPDALEAAARYFERSSSQRPVERFWIGKTLFRPEGTVAALVFSAKAALARSGFLDAQVVKDFVLASPHQQPVEATASDTPQPRRQRGPVKAVQHTVYSLQYHLVWTPKYHEKLLTGDVAEFVHETLLHVAREYGWEVEKLVLQPAYVHLVVHVPPRYAPETVAETMKSISEREVFEEFPRLHRRLWAGEFWHKGYFVRSAGEDITADEISAYLNFQEQGGLESSLPWD
jgi:REP element-mobilizing transposase RayT